MDLSKIPEPSEDDLQKVKWILFKYHSRMSENPRVIAHLLRHGSVLAAFAKRHNMHKTSVEFFEKFGGTP